MEVSSNRGRVAVVGGGVIGCATAYELARAGFGVTIIERDGIAAHASGRNAGNLNPLHGTPKALVSLALDALTIHKQIEAELVQLGSASYATLPLHRVHLGCDDADRQHLQETANLYNVTAGFSSRWIDGNDLRKLEPRLALDFSDAVVTTGGLTLDSYDFARSLADGACKLGARILLENALGVTTSGRCVTAVRTNQGSIPCDAVVLATGPWVEQAKEWLGVEIAVEPVKGELLLLELPGEALNCDFTWRSACLYRRRDNEVWVGGTQSNSGFDCATTQEGYKTLMDGAARIMPAIRRAKLIDHVAELRPVTPSMEPIASRAEGWENVYVANGGGFKGVLLCVAMARNIRVLLESEGR